MSTKKKNALMLLCNSILFIAAYFICIALEWGFITYVYVGLATLLGIIFIGYNRGFAAKNATPDQLPSTMTLAEKRAFIKEGEERLDRSRWMLTYIIPLVLAVAADLTYLFIFPYFEAVFS